MKSILNFSYQRFRMIRLVLTGSPDLFNNRPEAQASVHKFNENLIEIESLMLLQQESVSGYFAGKKLARSQLYQLTSQVLNIGLMMAAKTGNLALEQDFKSQYRELQKASDTGLQLIAGHVAAMLQPHAVALAGYGVTSDDLLSLETTTTDFSQSRETPKGVQHARKIRKARLDVLFKEEHAIPKDQLDRFFRYLGPEHADVARKYFYNRMRSTPVPKPPEEPLPDEGAEIAGTVTDKSTSLPLAGVLVTVDGQSKSCVTDTDGMFILSDFTEGEYSLRFTCFGYEDATLGPVQCAKDASLTLNFALEALKVSV